MSYVIHLWVTQSQNVLLLVAGTNACHNVQHTKIDSNSCPIDITGFSDRLEVSQPSINVQSTGCDINSKSDMQYLRVGINLRSGACDNDNACSQPDGTCT